MLTGQLGQGRLGFARVAFSLGVDPLLRIIVGILILGISIAMVVWHWRVWKQARADFELSREKKSTHSKQKQAQSTDSQEASSPYSLDDRQVYRYYRLQAIQRGITSGMIGLVGLMIIGSHWVRDPRTFALGFLATIITVVLVFISAILDAVRTQIFFRRNDLGFRRARRELMDEYERLKMMQAAQQKAEKEGDAGEATD